MEISEKEFERIVKENKDSIYIVCFMFADNADDADDLFQEILLNIWNGIREFRQSSAMSTWIWRVSLNTCISIRRKRSRRPDMRLTMDANLYEDNDENSRQIRLLRDRIHRLKPFDRAIVLLWLENLSYEEIGDIVGITAKNVSVRLFRIRQQLKNMSNK